MLIAVGGSGCALTGVDDDDRVLHRVNRPRTPCARRQSSDPASVDACLSQTVPVPLTAAQPVKPSNAKYTQKKSTCRFMSSIGTSRLDL